MPDLPWTCTLVGPLRDPAYVAAVRGAVARHGLDGRVRLTGPLTGAALDAAYAAADLLVVPSRAETYGMVVTEALARGIPVLASDAGGLPETLGRDPDGRVPGVVVPAGDAAALAAALRGWLIDSGAAGRAPAGARTSARPMLHGWEVTARCVAKTLIAQRRGPRGWDARLSTPGSPVCTPDWLALREPADAAARDPELAALAARPARRPGARWSIRDLGCGTGSLGRWLAPQLPGPQHWILHDRDTALLARAEAGLPDAAADGTPVTAAAERATSPASTPRSSPARRW